jgi:esterase FrsA
MSLGKPGSGGWFRDIRLDQWALQGGDPVVMCDVLARITASSADRSNPAWADTVIAAGAGNWLDEWSTAGSRALEAARSAQDVGAIERTRDALMEAALYYTIAAYPNHHESSRERDAYDCATKAYARAGQLTRLRIEPLEVDFEGGVLRAFLHLRMGIGPMPVVLTVGGIDVAKTTHFTLFKEYLAPAGFAMVSLDNAGFGDSSQWRADRPDMDRLCSALIDRLAYDPRLAPTRVGAMGVSYGGNTVARLAFTDPRVKAVVCAGGPIHHALDAGERLIENLPPMTRAALAARYGLPGDDAAGMGELVRAASLVNQGFVGRTLTQAPILAINNADDPLAPLSDLLRIADSSCGGSVVVTRGSGHCPPLPERYAAATEWFQRHL